MPEPSPRISDKAVEFWANRQLVKCTGGVERLSTLNNQKRRDELLRYAREDLTAILPLLCGEPCERCKGKGRGPLDMPCGQCNGTGSKSPSGELVEERDEAIKERDLAIAHDSQPYPTAEAYEKVCVARTKWQERAEKAQQELERVRGHVQDQRVAKVRAEQKLSEVRAEVEKRRETAEAELEGPNPTLCDRYTARICDDLLEFLDSSSSSLSGEAKDHSDERWETDPEKLLRLIWREKDGQRRRCSAFILLDKERTNPDLLAALGEMPRNTAYLSSEVEHMRLAQPDPEVPRCGDEVRIQRCPACERLSVDQPAVVRSVSCFDGHDEADWETIAVFHGRAAIAVWALFQIDQLATDGEAQGEALAAGAESIEAAISKMVNATWRRLSEVQPDCQSTPELLGEAKTPIDESYEPKHGDVLLTLSDGYDGPPKGTCVAVRGISRSGSRWTSMKVTDCQGGCWSLTPQTVNGRFVHWSRGIFDAFLQPVAESSGVELGDDLPANAWMQVSAPLLADETIKELTKQIVEGSDGEVISLPYQVVKDALTNVLRHLYPTQPVSESPGDRRTGGSR